MTGKDDYLRLISKWSSVVKKTQGFKQRNPELDY